AWQGSYQLLFSLPEGPKQLTPLQPRSKYLLFSILSTDKAILWNFVNSKVPLQLTDKACTKALSYY
ncbi:MAG: hypothetical protein WA874_02225, partial [Chryseosolibacter sp.]